MNKYEIRYFMIFFSHKSAHIFCFGSTTGTGHHYENYIGRNRYYRVEERVRRNLAGREKKCRKLSQFCELDKSWEVWFVSMSLCDLSRRPPMPVQQLWNTSSFSFSSSTSSSSSSSSPCQWPFNQECWLFHSLGLW